MCHSRIPKPLAQALPKGDTCPLEPVEAWRLARGPTGSSSSTPLSLSFTLSSFTPKLTSCYLKAPPILEAPGQALRNMARPWPLPGYESVFWGWGGGWTQGSTQRRAAWGPPTNHCCVLTVRSLDTGRCGHVRQHRDCAPDTPDGSTSAVTFKVIQAKAAPVAHGSGALRTPDMVCLPVGALDAEKGLDPPTTYTHTPDLLWEGCQHF